MIDGKAKLPPAAPVKVAALPDPDYRPDPTLAGAGANVYNQRCWACHGFGARSGGSAPELRASPIPQSAEAFTAIVRDGALVANGMPKFPELTDTDLAAVRQYLRSRATDLREGRD